MSGNEQQQMMKALVLHGVGDLRLEQVPRPVPGPGEVLVRVAYCGVCGSDVPRVFVKGTYSFPTICGHEFAGVVEECGPGVEQFQRGDRVAVFPLVWCDQCDACELGRYAQCRNYNYYGSRCDGAFAEYVVVRARNLLRVPDGVSLRSAAMTEPAAVALHALRRAGGALAGETVAIFGAGPIGIMVAQWARILGSTRVVLFDLVEEKLSIARKLGFSYVFNVKEQQPLEQINKLTAGRGAEVCVEAAGVPVTCVQAIEAACHGGRVVLLGNPSADVTLPAAVISKAMRRELDVLGTWNSSFSACGNTDDWHTVIDHLAAGTLDLECLVTHCVPLEKGIETLRMMHEGSSFFCKVLIEPE